MSACYKQCKWISWELHQNVWELWGVGYINELFDEFALSTRCYSLSSKATWVMHKKARILNSRNFFFPFFYILLCSAGSAGLTTSALTVTIGRSTRQVHQTRDAVKGGIFFYEMNCARISH